MITVVVPVTFTVLDAGAMKIKRVLVAVAEFGGPAAAANPAAVTVLIEVLVNVVVVEVKTVAVLVPVAFIEDGKADILTGGVSRVGLCQNVYATVGTKPIAA